MGVGRFWFDQARNRAPCPLDLNVLAYLAPRERAVLMQAERFLKASLAVRGYEPLNTYR